ncbi:MAG: hypothetical protein ACQEUZ_15730 [Pseudomonadota bacterium]
MRPRPVIDDLPPCHGAHPLTAPARLSAAAALAGLPARPFRRILLAECGAGAGLAMIAAALEGTGAQVIGATSDPGDAALARALLSEAALSAEVLDSAPGALAPEALPELDLVLLPFGWDRMDGPARAALARLLSARLAPGGGLLLIRDTPPGDWAETTLRRLLANRFAALGGPQAEGARRAELAEQALGALREMMPASHALIRGLPGWDAQLAELARLPGDLLHRLWIAPRGPVWSMRETAPWLAEAGLTLRAPAEPARLLPELDHTPEQRALIEAAPDPWTTEETAELLANRSRRADLFLRPGGPPADPGGLRLRPRPGADPARLVVQGLLGPATLSRAHHAPVLEAAALAADDPAGSAPLAALAARLGEAPAALVPRIAALIAAGALDPAADPPPGEAALAACARLNARLLALGAGRLASPALGGPCAPGPERLRALRAAPPDALAEPLPPAPH